MPSSFNLASTVMTAAPDSRTWGQGSADWKLQRRNMANLRAGECAVSNRSLDILPRSNAFWLTGAHARNHRCIGASIVRPLLKLVGRDSVPAPFELGGHGVPPHQCSLPHHCNTSPRLADRGQACETYISGSRKIYVPALFYKKD